MLLLLVFKVAPVMLCTVPMSIKLNGVLAAGKEVLCSFTSPRTATPYNLPPCKPALSITLVPVLFLFPTYTYTWPGVASSIPTTMVLSLA